MKRTTGGIAAVLALCCACSSISTNYDFDEKADFSTLRTYAWIPAPPEKNQDTLVTDRIHAAVDRELAAKGYRLVEQSPDFLVADHGSTNDRVRLVDWGMSYGRYGGRVGAGSTDVVEYQEGTLVLDVVDPKTKKLLWRGTAKKTLDPNPTPEERTKTINTAVRKLLAEFPPEKK